MHRLRVNVHGIWHLNSVKHRKSRPGATPAGQFGDEQLR